MAHELNWPRAAVWTLAFAGIQLAAATARAFFNSGHPVLIHMLGAVGRQKMSNARQQAGLKGYPEDIEVAKQSGWISVRGIYDMHHCFDDERASNDGVKSFDIRWTLSRLRCACGRWLLLRLKAGDWPVTDSDYEFRHGVVS